MNKSFVLTITVFVQICTRWWSSFCRASQEFSQEHSRLCLRAAFSAIFCKHHDCALGPGLQHSSLCLLLVLGGGNETRQVCSRCGLRSDCALAFGYLLVEDLRQFTLSVGWLGRKTAAGLSHVFDDDCLGTSTSGKMYLCFSAAFRGNCLPHQSCACTTKASFGPHAVETLCSFSKNKTNHYCKENA